MRNVLSNCRYGVAHFNWAFLQPASLKCLKCRAVRTHAAVVDVKRKGEASYLMSQLAAGCVYDSFNGIHFLGESFRNRSLISLY